MYIYIHIYLYYYHAQLTISSIFPQQSVTDPVTSFTRPPWDPVHLDLKGCHLPPRPSPRRGKMTHYIRFVATEATGRAQQI